MFTGEHSKKLDAKGRVVIPARFREELGNTVVVCRGLDGCLFAYAKEDWEAFAKQLEKTSVADIKARSFSRFFLAGAETLMGDKLGRILLPNTLRVYASLNSEVVWVGVGNRIEIWDKEKWESQMSNILEGEDNIDDLAAYMVEKGLL